MQIKECENGHFSEHFSSGRCKDCCSDYNLQYLEQMSPIIEDIQKKRKRKENRLLSQTEDKFEDSIKHRNWVAKRRYKKEGISEVDNFTPEDIKNILDSQNNECYACFVSFDEEPFEVDHIKHVSKFSKNSFSNLQLLCKTCNLRKSKQPNAKFISRVRYSQVLEYLMEIQEEESYAT